MKLSMKEGEALFGRGRWPYEIHLTVDLNGHSAEDFKAVCKQHGRTAEMKPIVVLLLGSGDELQDVMTSTRLSCSYMTLVCEINYQIGVMRDNGFDVTRVKVESSPWHEFAVNRPGYHGLDRKPDTYHEAHIAVTVSLEDVEHLKESFRACGFHPSRNAFKQAPEGKVVMMGTYRVEHVLTDFEDELRLQLYKLQCHGYRPDEKPEIEFALYDSNQNHDRAWMRG